MKFVDIDLKGLNLLEVFGINNTFLNVFITHYPNLIISSRGDELKVSGLKKEIELFQKNWIKYIDYYKSGFHLDVETVKSIIINKDIKEKFNNDQIILHTFKGKMVKARSKNQIKLVDSIKKYDLVFAIGPAGTGKTYTSIALAIRALKNKEVRKIVLCRPAVEAGENLGFLPGNINEKLDPYMQPLFDAISDMVNPKMLKEYFETKLIEILPLAFMRGRTLEDAFVILDEAQNATKVQLKMFLTRMGINSKFIVTGDLTQVDLPIKQKSGLQETLELLEPIKELKIIYLNELDVVRHSMVKKIIRQLE